MLFTFNSYKRLLEVILDHGYSIVGIESILESKRAESKGEANSNVEGASPNLKGTSPNLKGASPKYVAIRHDVDYFPKRAVRLAEIENQLNISVTYYIRRRFFDDNIETINKIESLGHQIGYHYEEIDTHQKAPNMQISRDAAGFFIGSLLDLDKLGFPIRSVCAHGNPLTDVDNRQVVHLVRDESFLDNLAFTFDKEVVRQKLSGVLLGDASIDITGDDFDLYIPDTGRFNPRFNLKDRIDNCPLTGLSSLADLEKILADPQNSRIYMNMHPDRWSGNGFVWLFDFGFDTLKNVLKLLIGKSSYQGKMVGSKAHKHHQSVLKSIGEKEDRTE